NALMLLVLLVACGPPRNITYLSNLESSAATETVGDAYPGIIIRPGDILNITVTSLSIESNALFNSHNATGDTEFAGYQVDEKGFIDFPLIGPVEVANHTKAQVRDILVAKLNEHVKNPIVNIRFLNFKVTVLGEVNNPSTF